jgi:hypothetical protein
MKAKLKWYCAVGLWFFEGTLLDLEARKTEAAEGDAKWWWSVGNGEASVTHGYADSIESAQLAAESCARQLLRAALKELGDE